jgi:hypothetical protein
MLAGIGVAVQIIHLSGVAVGEPIAEVGEVVSGRGRGDADRIEAESTGLFLEVGGESVG